MLAGDASLRNYTNTSLAQQAISYACLGLPIGGPETPYFPKQNCPWGIRSQVFFPSCWDGVNLDSPDHKSHMAYPSLMNNGVCPSSHPYRFLSLFYEVIWNTNDFKDQWYGDEQPFVWAMGDQTGYALHGDFINGWDQTTLQQAIDECNGSGAIEDCHVFELFPDSVTSGCKVPPSVDERVSGLLKALPGCNPVQSGPEPAKVVKGCGAPTTIGTPQVNFVDLTASKGFAYIGCGTDLAGQDRSLQGDRWVDASMTNEKCVDHCVSKGFTLAATEYSTECYCDNTIMGGRAPVPGIMGDCMMPCGGNSKEYCGGASQISIYKKCTGPCQNIDYTLNHGTSGTNSGKSSSSATSATARSSSAGVHGSSTTTAAPSSTQAAKAAANGVSDTECTTSAAKSGSSQHGAAAQGAVVVTETLTVLPLTSIPPAKQPLTVTVTVCGSTTIFPTNYPGITPQQPLSTGQTASAASCQSQATSSVAAAAAASSSFELQSSTMSSSSSLSQADPSIAATAAASSSAVQSSTTSTSSDDRPFPFHNATTANSTPSAGLRRRHAHGLRHRYV
jgi:hypothetical protein